MRVEQVDLFAKTPPNSAICVGTNGFIQNNGKGTMGGDPQGCPRVAKTLFKGIERNLGAELMAQGRPIGRAGVDSPKGNHVALIWQKPLIFSFPTKWSFWNDTDLSLVERSCIEMIKVADALKLQNIYLHPIGDGKDWFNEVKPLMKRYLDDRFVIRMGRN